ncbi:MAG: hypothetical protein K0R55_2093 [Sporomusa sp.]|jgi:hypothetical protein|nr:hypothetical protein [Sporomusa sp.]
MTIHRAVGGVNRVISAQYRAVGGVNRTIKEQYRGVAGVNRKVFASTPANALYWEGDECTAITGGWSAGGYTRNGGTVTKNANNMVVTTPASGTRTILTNSQINLTAFTKLKIEVTCTGADLSGIWAFLGVCTSRASTGTYAGMGVSLSTAITDLSGTRVTITLDIASISASRYVNITSDTGASSSYSITIHKVWLE